MATIRLRLHTYDISISCLHNYELNKHSCGNLLSRAAKHTGFLNMFQVEMTRQSGLPTVLTPDLGVYTFHFNKKKNPHLKGCLL